MDYSPFVSHHVYIFPVLGNPDIVEVFVGAGIDISTASGNMIIDLGGGTTDVSVISLGGIVTSTSVRVAGNKMDTALADYIRKKHGLAVGYQTAEEVKIRIGSALPVDKEDKIEVRGRDVIQGLPRPITVTTTEVVEAVQEQLQEIIDAVRLVLQETPPELSSDIIDKGMVLTGGTALLRNIDKFLSQATGVPAYVADDPSLCVAKGTGTALENLDSYKLSMLAVK